jgi:fatty acid desaturase
MTRPARSLACLDLACHALHVLLPLWGLALARALPLQLACSFLLYLGVFSLMHDAIHETLGLTRAQHRVLLSLSALALGSSGQATRRAHLHHHARPFSITDRESAFGERRLFVALGQGSLSLFALPLESCKRRARRGLERAEWLAVSGLCASLWLSSEVRARVFLGTLFVLRAASPVWAALIPHQPPRWLLAVARALAFSRLPLVTSLLDHEAHHLRPRVPTYSLSRVLRTRVAEVRATESAARGGLAIFLAAQAPASGLSPARPARALVRTPV